MKYILAWLGGDEIPKRNTSPWSKNVCRGDEGVQQQDMVGELASILISVVNVNTHPVHDMTSDQQSKTICAAVYPVSDLI